MAVVTSAAMRSNQTPSRSMVRARKTAGDLDAGSARLLVERNAVAVDGGFTWRHDPQLRLPSPYYLTEQQVLAQIGLLRCPVLCLIGERGYLLKRSFMAERYRRVADLRLVTVAGGHHMHLDDPGPSAAEIAAFMAAAQD